MNFDDENLAKNNNKINNNNLKEQDTRTILRARKKKKENTHTPQRDIKKKTGYVRSVRKKHKVNDETNAGEKEKKQPPATTTL